MDPNANLSEQLKLARKIQQEWDRDDFMPNFDPEDTARLALLVQALHRWLAQGGFLPEAWKR